MLLLLTPEQQTYDTETRFEIRQPSPPRLPIPRSHRRQQCPLLVGPLLVGGECLEPHLQLPLEASSRGPPLLVLRRGLLERGDDGRPRLCVLDVLRQLAILALVGLVQLAHSYCFETILELLGLVLHDEGLEVIVVLRPDAVAPLQQRCQ